MPRLWRNRRAHNPTHHHPRGRHHNSPGKPQPVVGGPRGEPRCDACASSCWQSWPCSPPSWPPPRPCRSSRTGWSGSTRPTSPRTCSTVRCDALAQVGQHGRGGRHVHPGAGGLRWTGAHAQLPDGVQQGHRRDQHHVRAAAGRPGQGARCRPNGTVYVGGAFNKLNGAEAFKITQINVATGQKVTAFKPKKTNAIVRDIRYTAGRLFMGGEFTTVQGAARSRLAELNPTTGALLPFDVPLAGAHYGGTTQVYHMDVTPDGSKMVIIGNFTTVGRSGPGRGRDDRPDDQHALQLADRPLQDALLQRLQVRRPRRRVLAGRLLLRHRHHRWVRTRLAVAVRQRGPVGDQRDRRGTEPDLDRLQRW